MIGPIPVCRRDVQAWSAEELGLSETKLPRVENRSRSRRIVKRKQINTTAVHYDPPASADKNLKHIQYQLLHLSRQSAAYFRRLERQPSSQHTILLAASVIEAH